MIPKDQKFDMRTQFLEFKKGASKARTANLSIYYTPSSSRKIAVVVPKKTIKGAVTRNSLKRILKKTLLENVHKSTVVVTAHPVKITKENLKNIATQLQTKLKELNV